MLFSRYCHSKFELIKKISFSIFKNNVGTECPVTKKNQRTKEKETGKLFKKIMFSRPRSNSPPFSNANIFATNDLEKFFFNTLRHFYSIKLKKIVLDA